MKPGIISRGGTRGAEGGVDSRPVTCGSPTAGLLINFDETHLMNVIKRIVNSFAVASRIWLEHYLADRLEKSRPGAL
jgi:hypothetical protein